MMMKKLIICLLLLSYQVNSIAETSKVPPVGEHPRILFSAKDIPAIKARAATPVGKRALQIIKWRVDNPGKALLKQPKDKYLSRLKDSSANYAYYAAVVYLVTDNKEYLELAKKFLKLWVKAMGPVPEQPVGGGGCGRGGDAVALAYDILYNELPETLKKQIKQHFISWLNPKANLEYWKKTGHQMGPSICGRGCDWGAISSASVVMACLATEGEVPEANQEAIDAALQMMNFVADYTITPEGHMPNGNGYIQGDFSDYFNALQGLSRRNIDLFKHPHIKKLPDWLAHEVIPGMYLYDNRNQSSGGLGVSPTIVALAVHGDQLAKWLLELGFGPNRRMVCSPGGAASLLLYGEIPDQPVPMPDNLPQSYFSSSMGTSFSRDGWEEGGAVFNVTMEPPGQCHTHRDKGSFTFYSQGLKMVGDTGVSRFGHDDHNLIFVDNKRGGQLHGQGALDAEVKTRLSSGLADVVEMDLKSAYTQVVGYTTEKGQKFNWCEMDYGKGLPLYWDKKNDVDHADRYAFFIRANPYSYAVIIDDFQKDDKLHKYYWLLHTPLKVVQKDGYLCFKNRGKTNGEHYTSVDKGYLTFTGNLPEKGNYYFWALTSTQPDLLNTHWYFHFKINGKGHRTYLGHHLNGWRWLRLKRNDKEPTWELPSGKVKIEMGVKPGARVADVLITQDPKFNPNLTTDEKINQQIKTEVVEKSIGEGKGWIKATERFPNAGMNIYFLEPEWKDLLAFYSPVNKLSYLNRLKIIQEKIKCGVAAVMLPFSSREEPNAKFKFNKETQGQATITHGKFTDYIAAYPLKTGNSKGPIQTDGKFALVRTEGDKIIGYLLSAGSKLTFNSEILVKSDKKQVTMVNDNQKIAVKAPGGAEIEFNKMDADNITCNNQPLSSSIRWFWKKLALLEVPQLPKEWDIDISDDGTIVTVTGDGEKPLKIHAPKVKKCIVNGLSVYFSRAPGGHIYPKLGITTLSHGNDQVK